MKATFLGYVINNPFKGTDGTDVQTFRLNFLRLDNLELVSFNPTSLPNSLKDIGVVTADALPVGELLYEVQQSRNGKWSARFGSFTTTHVASLRTKS